MSRGVLVRPFRGRSASQRRFFAKGKCRNSWDLGGAGGCVQRDEYPVDWLRRGFVKRFTSSLTGATRGPDISHPGARIDEPQHH